VCEASTSSGISSLSLITTTPSHLLRGGGPRFLRYYKRQKKTRMFNASSSRYEIVRPLIPGTIRNSRCTKKL
jgi:hypothetical protein